MTFEALPGKTLEHIVPEHSEKQEEAYSNLRTKKLRREKEVVILMVALHKSGRLGQPHLINSE